MAEFKKNNRFSGAPKRSYSNSSQHSSPPRELFDAQCNSCRERCQVPFRPNGKKPVYCTNCFNKNEGQAPGGYSRDSRDSRDSRGPRPEYAPSRLEKAPTSTVPDRQIQELTKQIEIMNMTVEKLVTAVDTFNRATALTKEIRKHFPADKPAAAPAKTTTKKAVAKKEKAVVKSAPKATAKKKAA